MLHEPLEFEYWFVQVFSGTWEIFSLISIMAITYLCAMFRMPTSAFVGVIVLYAAILFAANQSFLLILLILILAPLFFWLTRRLVD